MSKPRKLTDIEIKELLNFLPKPKAAVPKVANFAHDKILLVVESILRKYEIVPEGIKNLREKLNNLYESSIVNPGEMVGLLATSFQGAIIQQSTLNSFHGAGQAGNQGPVSALEVLRGIFEVIKNPANQRCQIILKDGDLDYEQIWLNYRTKLIEVSVQKILKDYDIEYSSSMFRDNKLPYWYYFFSETYDRKLPSLEEDVRVLRLYFDPTTLLEYQVTLNDICDTIYNKTKKEINSIFLCIPSPIELGYVDIWIDKDTVEECYSGVNLTLDESSFICFNNVLIPYLDKYKIKGVNGIKEIYPAKINKFETFVYRHENITGKDKKQRTKIYSSRKFEVSGIYWSEITELFNHVSKVIEVNEKNEYIIVDKSFKELEEIFTKASVGKVDDFLNKKIWFNYIVSDGSNLKEILSLPFVRTNGTISSLPQEVIQVFGIDAATSIFVKQVFDFFEIDDKKTNINIRHIYLMAEFTSHFGFLVPHTYAGIMKQHKTTLTGASFERQWDTVMNAAIMGNRESLNDNSSGITFNQRLEVGPSAYEEQENSLKGITTDELREKLKNIKINSSDLEDVLDRKGLAKYYEDITKNVSKNINDDDEERDDDEIPDDLLEFEEELEKNKLKIKETKYVDKTSFSDTYDERLMLTAPTNALEYATDNLTADDIFKSYQEPPAEVEQKRQEEYKKERVSKKKETKKINKVNFE